MDDVQPPNTIQLICWKPKGFLAEYHLLVNGKSVGKCPWKGGRNTGCYYEKDIGNQKRKFDCTWWRSLDGPTPWTDNGVTTGNYPTGTFDSGEKWDTDGDGKIDANTYFHRVGTNTVTKRHYEICLDSTPLKGVENKQNKKDFPPASDFFQVPSDRPGNNRRLQVGESAPDDQPADESMGVDDTLPEDFLWESFEDVEFETTVYPVRVEVQNGQALNAEAIVNGIAVFIQEETSAGGGGHIFAPESLVTAQGFELGNPSMVFVNSEMYIPSTPPFINGTEEVFEYAFSGLGPFLVSIVYGDFF
jgi:hypothetical protein